MRLRLLGIIVLSAAAGCTPRGEPKVVINNPSGVPNSWSPPPGPAVSEPTTVADSPASPQIVDVAKDYKQLRLMTPDRVFVDLGLAMDCRGASQREVEDARKKSGPHACTAIRIYMNDLAADAFRRSATPYPVGSVIVKEKEGLDYHVEGQDRTAKTTRDGVGGMIKRHPGYDPAHGEWEYFYFEDPSKIESGKISSCVQCHAGASKRDYVFGDWSRPGLRLIAPDAD